jgi:uncharacterized protein
LDFRFPVRRCSSGCRRFGIQRPHHAICDQIIAEVRATLVRKFSWKDEEVLAMLTIYQRWDTCRRDGNIGQVCRDPKDDMVFECAVKAESEIIISGDNDLISVKTFRGIQVLTARQYLDRFTRP